MKARVVTRRDDSAVPSAAVSAVEGASLLQLLVVELTEEGNRCPIKVARLMPLAVAVMPSYSSAFDLLTTEPATSKRGGARRCAKARTSAFGACGHNDSVMPTLYDVKTTSTLSTGNRYHMRDI